MQGDELLAELRRLVTLERQVHSNVTDIVAQLANEHIAQDKGYASIVALLMDMLQIQEATVKQLVRQAEQTGPRQTMTGQPLEPKRPLVAAAMASGELNTDQFNSITDVLDQAAERATGDVVGDLEAELVEQARGRTARGLSLYANRRLAEIDQDGREPNDLPPHTGNRLYLRPKSDGGAKFHGELDALGYATVRKVLNALNQPVKGPDGTRDDRTRANRDGDALVEAARLLLNHGGGLTADGGERPHITVTVEYDVLRREFGTTGLDTGEELSGAELRMLCCDARILPIIMGGPSGKWDIGHDKYRVTGSLRKLLVTRDQRCAFPACDRPSEWCHAHHLTSFHRDDGPSELNNLCLLCSQHHRLIHASDWEIEMINGRPWFIPPAFIDPERNPLFNDWPGRVDPAQNAPPGDQQATSSP